MSGIEWRTFWVGPVCVLAMAHQCAVAADKFFTVEQRNNVWWFADTQSKPFFSLGVNVVTPGASEESYDQQRPEYAAWRHYASKSAWAKATASRLRGWNFNTLGGWSDRAVTSAMPYTEVLHLGVGAGVPWNDLFAKEFAEQMDQAVKERVAPRRRDQNLVGWFTDNELGWYDNDIFAFHAAQPASSGTRRRLVEILEAHYQNDFAAFERDFEVENDLQSFEELGRGGAVKLRPGGRGRSVVDEFIGQVADRYYDVVCGAIRRHDPHHLILGDRYHGYCPDAVVKAAGKHVDVVSTNFDWPAGVDGYLPSCYLQRLHALSDKPVLITEYYAAARENRSGNPNTGGLFLVVGTQAERTAVAQRRLEFFAAQPFVVGAHWFAYTDEPPHGRTHDGEDYNFGLVDINNRPYDELTAAVSTTQAELAARHQSATGPLGTTDAAQVVRLPTAPPQDGLDAVKESLLSQTLLRPGQSGSLADLHLASDGATIHVTLSGNHFVGAEHYSSPPSPVEDGLTWKLRVGAREIKASMLGERVEVIPHDATFSHWSRGVRFGATVAIPINDAAALKLQPHDEIKLQSELRDGGSGAISTWKSTLKLSPADGVEVVGATNGTIEPQE